jgi:hypothetical protein
LHYPKITGSKDAPNGPCIAFEKLDGTNLHWCWDREVGWHAFGTRRDQFNLTDQGIEQFGLAHPELTEAPNVFELMLAGQLERVLKSNTTYASVDSIKLFTEFLGPNSFAGGHRFGEPKKTYLLDVMIEGQGFIEPQRFVSDFGHLPVPRIIYRGKLTGTFLESVREGKWDVSEGVVCKGQTAGKVWMVKVKTYAYLQRLKDHFAENWNDFWE